MRRYKLLPPTRWMLCRAPSRHGAPPSPRQGGLGRDQGGCASGLRSFPPHHQAPSRARPFAHPRRPIVLAGAGEVWVAGTGRDGGVGNSGDAGELPPKCGRAGASWRAPRTYRPSPKAGSPAGSDPLLQPAALLSPIGGFAVNWRLSWVERRVHASGAVRQAVQGRHECEPAIWALGQLDLLHGCGAPALQPVAVTRPWQSPH